MRGKDCFSGAAVEDIHWQVMQWCGAAASCAQGVGTPWTLQKLNYSKPRLLTPSTARLVHSPNYQEQGRTHHRSARRPHPQIRPLLRLFLRLPSYKETFYKQYLVFREPLTAVRDLFSIPKWICFRLLGPWTSIGSLHDRLRPIELH